jgi:putative transposon-encoded protein
MKTSVKSPPVLFRKVITPNEQDDNIAIPKEWFGMKVEVIVWGVSQTEPARRSLSGTVTGDPVSALHEFHESGGLASVESDEYLRQVRHDRKNWK